MRHMNRQHICPCNTHNDTHHNLKCLVVDFLDLVLGPSSLGLYITGLCAVCTK
jgi:hypothetical protein